MFKLVKGQSILLAPPINLLPLDIVVFWGVFASTRHPLRPFLLLRLVVVVDLAGARMDKVFVNAQVIVELHRV